jgi:hypothetical protein
LIEIFTFLFRDFFENQITVRCNDGSISLFNLKGLGRVYIIRPSYREYDDLKNLTVAQATLATPWIRPCVHGLLKLLIN